MLPMSIRLYRHSTELAHLCARHWWLTAFDMGLYANPRELSMEVCITFPNRTMMVSFVNALDATDKCSYQVRGLRVFIVFTYCSSCVLSPIRKLLCRFKQWQNRLLCRLFRWVTKPFTSSLDRLLCLYFYLPSILRRLLRNKKRKKCHNKCCKKCRHCIGR